jgi:hypothetical protein
VHELAHQWFGDSVSLKNWQDLWLKEGAATYAEWLWTYRGKSLEDLNEYVQNEREFYHPEGNPGAPNAGDLYGWYSFGVARQHGAGLARALGISLLKDWRGLEVGRLVMLRDVTEQKQAQAQILEQQRVMATLIERERMARAARQPRAGAGVRRFPGRSRHQADARWQGRYRGRPARAPGLYDRCG